MSDTVIFIVGMAVFAISLVSTVIVTVSPNGPRRKEPVAGPED
ncbi:MAG: hypothetical protein RIK87_02320 [Fuerstiella sp.]